MTFIVPFVNGEIIILDAQMKLKIIMIQNIVYDEKERMLNNKVNKIN